MMGSHFGTTYSLVILWLWIQRASFRILRVRPMKSLQLSRTMLAGFGLGRGPTPSFMMERSLPRSEIRVGLLSMFVHLALTGREISGWQAVDFGVMMVIHARILRTIQWYTFTQIKTIISCSV